MNTTWIGMDENGNHVYLDLEDSMGSFNYSENCETYMDSENEIIAVVKYLGDERNDCIEVLYAARHWELQTSSGEWITMYPFTPCNPHHLP